MVHKARRSLTNVEKESLKRFTDSYSVANTVKKDVGQSHGKRFRIVVSRLREGFRSVGNVSQTWLPPHQQVADLLAKTLEKNMLTALFN